MKIIPHLFQEKIEITFARYSIKIYINQIVLSACLHPSPLLSPEISLHFTTHSPTSYKFLSSLSTKETSRILDEMLLKILREEKSNLKNKL